MNKFLLGNKKIIFLLGLVVLLGVIAARMLNLASSKTALTNPQSITQKKTQPSQTLKEYQDPVGFSFNYPDNLSLAKNEIEDSSVYSDLQLFSKDISGSLNLKIADSRFASLGDWLKSNKIASASAKETSLGNIKALEAKLSDRLILAVLDQGVLFTIEMPALEQDYWRQVYNQVLASFSFSSPEVSQGPSSSTNDVTFEAEEVVE